jgi:hypothetical protein
MANAFSKEEIVAFDEMIDGFEDALVLSNLVSVKNTDQTQMARTNDIMWRPMPYVATSFDGRDQTVNFRQYTQLSVPATIGFRKSVPFQFDDGEYRDELQSGRLGEAAIQRLSSDINLAVNAVVTNQGTLFVKRTAAAVGFDDVAQVDTLLNSQGISFAGRNLALSSSDYNSMVSDLQKNTRSLDNDISARALREAYLGRVGSIDTFKLDYAPRKAAAAGGGGLTIDTRAASAGGVNIYVPKATSVASTGESGNVDNRFQRVTVSSTTNVAAGDAFTIAGQEACHQITKQTTGALRTFRVISVDSATTMTISPPLITGTGGTQAELSYQNVVQTASASNSAIVFLNTAAGFLNPFWMRNSIEILPGKIALPSGSGVEIMRGSTKQGFELVMQKSVDIKTGQILCRYDTSFGVVNLQPQMNGVMMFSQT